MSQFPIFNSRTSPFVDKSTLTKPTQPFLPNLNLTKEEIQKEKESFLGFLNNTIEGDTFTQMSLVDHHHKKTIGDYYKLKEEWYTQANQTKPNNTDKVLEAWRLDRTDTPLLSISVSPEGFGIFQPKKLATGTGSWDNTDYFTFAGSSAWGTLLSKENAAPQFSELMGRNAQSNHFAAIRARGGKNGELWQNVVARSPWLAKMFTESETTKEAIDSWINSTPSLVNLKASIPLSAYFGDTMLDILKDAPIPEGPDGWDAKKAIEELKIADPILSDILFREMGVKEETLVELGQNPIQFKFFIADAIDHYAYTSYLREYSQSAGGFENFANTMAWPLVRDSFNSNDNFAELLAIAGGLIVTAGTAGTAAAPGIATTVAGATSFVLKPLVVIRRGIKAYDRYETISKSLATAAKINQVIWKAQKVLPSNLTNTVFDATGITKKFFTAPAQAGRTRKVLTYGAEQFIGEGAQGIVESVINQSEAIENGFQERFSLSDIGYNALEEGIGGLVLGGVIRVAGRSAEQLTTTQLGEYVTRKIGEAKANTISTVTEALPADAKKNVRLATNIILGIPDGVDFESYSNAVETELRLTAVIDRVAKTTKLGNILEPGIVGDPLLNSLLRLVTGGNASQDFAARVEVLRRIDSAIDKTTDSTTGKSNLTGEDVEALLFLTGIAQSKNNPASKTQLIEAMWLSKKFSEGQKTNASGKPLSASDMTETDIKNISEEIDTKIQSFVTKLGAKSSEEVEMIFGKSIGKKEEETLQSVIQEKQEEINEKGTNVSIDLGNLPLEGTIPNTLNAQVKEETKVQEEPTVEPVPEVTETITKPEVKVTETPVTDLARSLLENLEKPDPNLDTDIDLTPEEEADLRSRTCYIERD